MHEARLAAQACSPTLLWFSTSRLLLKVADELATSESVTSQLGNFGAPPAEAGLPTAHKRHDSGHGSELQPSLSASHASVISAVS
jgi:hypothetical protein